MSDFEDIRPYQDDEVKGVIARLLDDREFLDFLSTYHSRRLSRVALPVVRFIVRQTLKRQLGHVTNVAEFQQVISKYARRIVTETMTSFQFDGMKNLDKAKAYLYVSNHRDIAGDSMLVDYALWQSGFDTVRIAVGDNLVQREFATDLMKLNKSFFIKRSQEGAKKIFAALLQSSRYIHDSLAKGQSIWIAQSEGRAKDGLDETDPTIIKMFALAERKAPLSETVRNLNIVPVSISYEFDPCDSLKAGELEAVTTRGKYEKPAGEDLLSLVKGLGDFKGHVVLKFGEPLRGDYETPEEVANAIDRQVLDNYQLFPVNYWALRELANLGVSGQYETVWNVLGGNVEIGDTTFLQARLAACPEAHQEYWLKMYANPVINKYQSKSTHLAPFRQA